MSLGRVAQSVASPTAEPGVVSLILAWYHNFVEINHEIYAHSPLSAYSRRVVANNKHKYVHGVLAYGLVKLA